MVERNFCNLQSQNLFCLFWFFLVIFPNSAVGLEGRSMAKVDHYYLLKTTYGIHNIILQLCKKVRI